MPPLTPAEAAQQSVLLEPRARVARCEKGANGQGDGPRVFVDADESVAVTLRSRGGRRFSRPPLVYTLSVIWELVFMLVILKIPVVYLCWVVWWAVRAEPEPLEGAGRLVAVLPRRARLRLASATARSGSRRGRPKPARRRAHAHAERVLHARGRLAP